MPFLSARFNGIPRLEEAASNSRTMKYGETDPAVAVIQQALIDAGISSMPISTKKTGVPDGIFKSETKSAVKAFQRRKPFPLDDDGIIGRDTMAKLDEFFKTAPKPVAPPPSGAIVLPSPGLARRDEVIRILMDEARLTRPEATGISDALFAFNVGRHGVILLQIVEVVSATGAIAASAAALGAIGFIIGSLITLSNAMATGYRIAGNLGYMYGTTAWAFDKPKPGFSKQLRENIMGSGSATDIHRFEATWKTGVHKAFEDGPRARHSLRVKGKPVDLDTFKLFLRLFGDNTPGRFSFLLSKEIARKISNNIERRTFVSSVNSGCIYNL